MLNPRVLKCFVLFCFALLLYFSAFLCSFCHVFVLSKRRPAKTNYIRRIPYSIFQVRPALGSQKKKNHMGIFKKTVFTRCFVNKKISIPTIMLRFPLLFRGTKTGSLAINPLFLFSLNGVHQKSRLPWRFLGGFLL